MALWSFPYADTIGEPLVSPWWIPGFTSQNPDYIYAAPNLITAQGFPPNLAYVTVIGSYFDTLADPTSGYLTFWPSSSLTFDVSGQITYMPQRYGGVNQTLLGVNQMGSGKIYLWYGHLAVNLLATDNANMTPVSFTYHVEEHYFKGLQYDISVPSSYSSTPIDIHSLIVPGTIRPVGDTLYDNVCDIERIAHTSSQWLVTKLTPYMLGSSDFNPTSYPVNFAFTNGSIPSDNSWIPGEWASSSAPYIAQVLIGPNGYILQPGSYKVWAQVVAPPQVPVIPIGQVEIY